MNIRFGCEGRRSRIRRLLHPVPSRYRTGLRRNRLGSQIGLLKNSRWNVVFGVLSSVPWIVTVGLEKEAEVSTGSFWGLFVALSPSACGSLGVDVFAGS